MASRHAAGLGFGKTQRGRRWRFAGQCGFNDIRRNGDERQTEAGEKILSIA
jgi:hypothetical protein